MKPGPNGSPYSPHSDQRSRGSKHATPLGGDPQAAHQLTLPIESSPHEQQLTQVNSMAHGSSSTEKFSASGTKEHPGINVTPHLEALPAFSLQPTQSPATTTAPAQATTDGRVSVLEQFGMRKSTIEHEERASDEEANLKSSSPARQTHHEQLDLFMTKEKIREFQLGPNHATQKARAEQDLMLLSSKGSLGESRIREEVFATENKLGNLEVQFQQPVHGGAFYQTQTKVFEEAKEDQSAQVAPCTTHGLAGDATIEKRAAAISQQQRQMCFESTAGKDIFERSGLIDVPGRPTSSDAQSLATTNMSNDQWLMTCARSSSTAPASCLETPQAKAPSEEQAESLCTLFLIFGLNATKYVENNKETSYEILGSYPSLSDEAVANEHKFTNDLKMICFPEVALKVEDYSQSHSDPVCRCSFFHFISTDDLGERKYLTSIQFKEILLCQQGAFIIPKAICVASKQPIFSLQKEMLTLIFQQVVLKNNKVSAMAFREAASIYNDNEFGRPPTYDMGMFVDKFMTDLVMCVENRKTKDGSRSPTTRNSRLASETSPQIPLPKVDFTPVLELYITIFCRHLYYNPKMKREFQIVLSKESSTAAQPIYAPLETSAGQKSRKQDKQKHEPLFKFRNAEPDRFHLENFQFDLLLQKLQPERIIQLWTALLLERKIVLIKNDIGDIALIMQALLTLLSPFQWCFTLITYLTRDLVDMLDAPFPFLIGVSTATWDHICTIKEFPDDIFIFDLESNERRYIPKLELQGLPQPHCDELLNGLKDIMFNKERRHHSLMQEKTRLRDNRLLKQFDEQYWADAQLSVKQLFFNFLLVSVDNYIMYFKTDKELAAESGAPETQIMSRKLGSDEVFQFEEYLEAQDKRSLRDKDENNLFIREFVQTQSFNKFIEQTSQSMRDEAEAVPAVVFFEACVELCSENKMNMKRLKAAQQEMIDQARHNLATPVRFKFNGILTKYVEGLRKRELHRQACQERGRAADGRKFSELSDAEQIEDIIMRYILSRQGDVNRFHQLSIIQDINTEMVFEQMPRIRYDLAERYRDQIYNKQKEQKPVAVKPGDNPPHAMEIKRDKNLTQRKRRSGNQSEMEYQNYINGKQSSDNFEEAEQAKAKASPKEVPFTSSKQARKTSNLRIASHAGVLDKSDLKSKGSNLSGIHTSLQQSADKRLHGHFKRSPTAEQISISFQSKQARNSHYNIQQISTNKAHNYFKLGKSSLTTTAAQGLDVPSAPKANLRKTRSPQAALHKVNQVMSQPRLLSKVESARPVHPSRSPSSTLNKIRGKLPVRNKSQISGQEQSRKPAIKQMPLQTFKKRTGFNEKVNLARSRGSFQHATLGTLASSDQLQIIELTQNATGEHQAMVFTEDEEPLRKKKTGNKVGVLSSSRSREVRQIKTNCLSISSKQSLTSKRYLASAQYLNQLHKSSHQQSTEKKINFHPQQSKKNQIQGSLPQNKNTEHSVKTRNKLRQMPLSQQSSMVGEALPRPQLGPSLSQIAQPRVPEYIEKRAIQSAINSMRISYESIPNQTHMSGHSATQKPLQVPLQSRGSPAQVQDDDEDISLNLEEHEVNNQQAAQQAGSPTNESPGENQTNEKIEDEACITQKTAYSNIEFKSKFNQLNCEELRLGPSRPQMMPNQNRSEFVAKATFSSLHLSSQGSSFNLKSSGLRETVGTNSSMTECQSMKVLNSGDQLRRSDAAPNILRTLLQKPGANTGRHASKRYDDSHTISIAEKQRAQGNPQGSTSNQSQIDLLIGRKSFQQKEKDEGNMLLPVQRQMGHVRRVTSNMMEETKVAALRERDDSEDPENGWFTTSDMKRNQSEVFEASRPVRVSQETKLKLLNLYEGINDELDMPYTKCPTLHVSLNQPQQQAAVTIQPTGQLSPANLTSSPGNTKSPQSGHQQSFK